MKKPALLLILILTYSTVFAQNQSEIVRISSGEHKFAKGAIFVSLADTVSPAFIEYQFERLGYEILKADISQVRGYFTNNLSESKMAELTSHPYIKEVLVRDRGFNEKTFLEMVKRQNMNSEDSLRSRKAFQRMAENPMKHVLFNYYVTEEMATTFSQTLHDIELKISMASPKSVIIKTVPGKEQEAMKTVERLVYVESTAFVMLENEQ